MTIVPASAHKNVIDVARQSLPTSRRARYNNKPKEYRMVDLRTYVLFLVAALAVIAAPGPDILYVLSRGISGGKRTGAISALGIACGEVLHTVLAVLGLAALLQASAAAFLAVKYVGALYLVYLGIRLVSARNHAALQSFSDAGGWSVFLQGVLTNLFNPKAIIFYVTFLPQFVNPSHGRARFQLFALGLTFAVLDVIFLEVLAHFAGYANAWLTRRPENARRVRLGTGSLLIGLGVRLAFVERN
jgi:threonine/homoserine/homoserine lactone efflux protein